MPVIKPLAGSPAAPQQHKQPSRKGRRAWRKNVDVTEVEEGLDRRNLEIIQGGIIAEKASSELFTLDVVGDPTNSRKLPKRSKSSINHKGLKADAILAQRSAVPAVPMRKRAGDGGKTTDGVLPAKRQRTDYVSHRELTRLRNVADGRHDSTVAVEDATYDVWAEDETANDRKYKDGAGEQEEEEKEGFSFLPKPRRPKAPRTISQKPVSLTANGKDLPAVPKPKGGYSYNPVFTDYEARLMEESAKVVEAERKRAAEAEAKRLKLEAAARSAAEAEAAEARAELSEWEEESAWEGFESGPGEGGEEEEVNIKAKRPERKTQAQRNRIKKRKEEERLAKHAAAMKRRRAQEQQIQEIAHDVEERERVLALEKIEMSDGSTEGNDEELRRRQLGKFRLPEKDMELVLPDELQDSLRLLKPEGNLLKERYRNMLVRGKMEARVKIPFRKQAKAKFTEKWTYKDFNI